MFPGLTGIKSTPAMTNTKGIGGDNKFMGPIATQNLGGNSLTQFMRSMQNYMGTEGANVFQRGQDITTSGVQGFGTAGDTSGKAVGTTEAALKTLDPAESYWQKLLSGDKKTMNEAISPYSTQAGLNYANASTTAAQNMPRGGYAAVLGAQLPQAQARDVNEQLFKLQPAAAENLNTIAGTKNQIAGTQGNIAGIQGQIANWLSSIGIDVSKLGADFLRMMTESVMTGRGQDVAEHGQSMSLAGQLGSTAMTGVDHGLTSYLNRKP